jgi:hypothetical protein
LTKNSTPAPGRSARTARDVLDILLVDMLGQLDYALTRTAAERIFAERATHAFPPSAALPAEWRRELENLAQDLGAVRRMRKESRRNSRLRWRRLHLDREVSFPRGRETLR